MDADADADALGVRIDERKSDSKLDRITVGVTFWVGVAERVRFGEGVGLRFSQAITWAVRITEAVGQADGDTDLEAERRADR
jgi:hypothetical protein